MLDKNSVATLSGKDFIRQALSNAKQFLSDARVLIGSGSFGHSAALSVLAMEEAAKAKRALRYLGPRGELKLDSRTYKKEFKSHTEKVELIAQEQFREKLAKLIVPEGKKQTLQETYERLKDLMQGAEEEKQRDLEVEIYMLLALPILKEKWLYVDIEKGEVTSPLTWSKQDALEILNQATVKVNSYSDELENELRSS
mgnify:CR=1 FL=1